MTRVVDVAGVAVALDADDQVHRDAIDATCALLVDVDGPPTVRIAFGATAPGLPDEPFDLADGDVRAWWRNGSLLLGHGPFAGVVHGAEARIGGDGNCRRVFRQLFPYVVTQLLAPHGRFVLHGGAIERDGVGALVLGGTGAGKSTVVSSAMLAGWRPLADDLVFLRSGRDAVEVGGIAKPITVDRDVAELTGLPWRDLEGDVRGRCQLLVDLERSVVPLSTTVVAAHADTAASARHPMGSASLTEWLLYSFLVRHDPTQRAPYLPVLAAAVRQGGAELHHGTDVRERVAAVGALLEQWRDGEPLEAPADEPAVG